MLTREDLSQRRYQAADRGLCERHREILVGYRTGPLLAQRRRSAGPVRTGRSVEPHLRWAHWHHYWVGIVDEGDRRLELRWINPTLAGGSPVRARVRDVVTATGA